MTTFDKFTAVFIMTLVFGLGYMIYHAVGNRAECVKAALNQQYTSAEIKQICR